ncbi:MAG: hypothetical protein CVT84_03675 [Alphaproteobacteria bacterium HGW-Alphaproteobacteria-6]|nr:MAG: hypothetical protein CVT84_03675 [Alphaproteobacteria bacterium HGW-Alphaproteobacteria-6]
MADQLPDPPQGHSGADAQGPFLLPGAGHSEGRRRPPPPGCRRLFATDTKAPSSSLGSAL